MPPPTNQNPPQLAEISRLGVRLSVAQKKLGSLLQNLIHIQTQRANQHANINSLRTQIIQTQQEARTASSNNRQDEYKYKVEVIAEQTWRMTCSTREWEESGGRIERVTRDVRELELEISGLERLLLALKTGGNQR